MNKGELKELAATLNGIADGKAWEYLSRDWCTPQYGLMYYIKLDIPIRLKPWSLPPPPEGIQWHRDGWTEEMLPEGWRPLLKDETKLPGDEIAPSPFAGKHTWVAYTAECPYVADDSVYWFIRTRRPLPQPQQLDPYAELKAAHAAGKVIQWRFKDATAWMDKLANFDEYPDNCDFRIKPEQQKVPLEPSDVPPGSVIRNDPANAYVAWWGIIMVTVQGVLLGHQEPKIKTYAALLSQGDQINRSIPLTGKWNPETWEPCYKLIDTP